MFVCGGENTEKMYERKQLSRKCRKYDDEEFVIHLNYIFFFIDQVCTGAVEPT